MARLATHLLFASSLLSLAAADGTLRWDIQKNHDVQAAQLKARSLALQRRALGERADTLTATLDNSIQAGLYSANISVGTPAQSLSVQIDTGSSDVWIPSSQASICSDEKDGGCPGGSFDPTSSSTYVDVEPDGFNISYVDGTGSTGDYFQDTFSIAGGEVKNFQMGLATNTSIGIGIMGIGYNSSEANVDTGNGTIYPNLPYALANAGLINANAYSLWLNDLQATSGSVLFGGVDTAKYTGDLISIKVYPSSYSNRVTSFTVAFTSLSATSSSGTDQLTPSNYAEATILDSGTTITLLPDDVAQAVFDELGATVSNELGATIVPCSLASNPGTLNYGFGGPGGPVIKVSMEQLVLPLTLPNGKTPTYSNGESACQLGIQAAGDLPVLFGDTFLRSAYVVYDLDNNRIALAQTDFNSTDSHVVAFPSSGAPIPSATSAANEDQVTQTASAVPKVGGGSAAGSGTTVTFNPTATGFSAASGFGSSAPTSTGGGKKSAGPSGPEPFRWAPVFVLGATLVGMLAGTGIFALL